MFGNDRASLRALYRDALEKAEAGQPLTALETQIAAVIQEHPEYRHDILPSALHAGEPLDKDYPTELGQTNPFMHLSLHLAVRDQISTDRPQGIRAAFLALEARCGQAHDAEHQLSEKLAEELWRAQRYQQPPDEQRYFQAVQSLIEQK
ncbi:MAG: DUF1841 family protein [Pseudomonadota bacterium]